MLFYKKENRFPYALRVNTSLRYRCVYDKKKVLEGRKAWKVPKKKKTVALLCKDYAVECLFSRIFSKSPLILEAYWYTKIGTTGCAIYRHFAALNYAVVLMTRKPDSGRAQHPLHACLSGEFFSLRFSGLSLHDLTSIRAKKMHHGSTADTGIIVLPESIIRPLNNDSLEDGNKAPCYPANTVIARSAHNGTLATHSFRTHEPTEFQRKGVNLS